MTKIARQSYGLLIALCLAAQSCSSEPPPAKVNHSTGKWDYDQIRQQRENERVQSPTPADLANQAEDDANCVVMTLAEKNRSKTMGCRKLDARAGQGPDAWCCPPQNKSL